MTSRIRKNLEFTKMRVYPTFAENLGMARSWVQKVSLLHLISLHPKKWLTLVGEPLLSLSCFEAWAYIMPPMPPMPPMGSAPPVPQPQPFASGMSATRHSVVSMRPAMEAAF